MGSIWSLTERDVFVANATNRTLLWVSATRPDEFKDEIHDRNLLRAFGHDKLRLIPPSSKKIPTLCRVPGNHTAFYLYEEKDDDSWTKVHSSQFISNTNNFIKIGTDFSVTQFILPCRPEEYYIERFRGPVMLKPGETVRI